MSTSFSSPAVTAGHRLGAALCILLLSTVAGRAQSPSPLVITDSLGFALLDSPKRGVAFTVDATEAAIHGFRVTARDVRNPDGTTNNPEVVTVQADTVVTAGRGARVSLVPDPQAFRSPGAYSLPLLLSGTVDGKRVIERVVVRLTRPTPVLEVEPLKDRAFRLRRSLPGRSASVTDTLYLRNSGRVTAVSLAVTGADVLPKEGNEELRASFSARLLDASDLAPGAQVPVEVKLNRFESAGEYRTGLRIASPSLDAMISVPLSVQVYDWWLLPLVVIGLGVLAGLVVRQVAERWRPAQENRYRLAQLVAEIARWRPLVSKEDAQTLEQQRLVLREAEEQNELGRTGDATTKLDTVAQALNALRTRQHELRTEAWRRHGAVRAQLDGIVAHRDTLTDPQRRELEELAAGVLAIESVLTSGRAAAAIDELSRLEQRAQRLATEAAAGRGSPPAAAPAPPRSPLAIEIVDPPDGRTVGSTLSFRASDHSGLLHEGDILGWDFGDGTAEVEVTVPVPQAGAVTVRHAYEVADDYLVKLSVRRTGEEVAKAFVPLAVQSPPLDRRLARIRASLRRADVALSLLAFALALVIGLSTLYFGKLFGTPQDYVGAFLWGFGIDSGVKTVSDVLKRVGG